MDENTPVNGTRINKWLSNAGICSRREADRMLEEGRITIDGVRAVPGSRLLPGQTVAIDGRPVHEDGARKVLIAFNKPKGIVCTTDTRREKDNIIDYIQYGSRIYPIGRLDKDSEGLILLTNDGSIVNGILRARNYHEKEYIVSVDKPVTAQFLQQMASGVQLEEAVTRPCRVRRLAPRRFSIILTQGLNRQIRRMCQTLGWRVTDLRRIRIMNIELGSLETGKWRYVEGRELEELLRLIQKQK
ncbi:MAG: pseudouridine synthase [Lachnospiraceae bacterium]|jgi:23S rRNA pseudouridine2604 synthase